MQVSIKTNQQTENGYITIHFAGDDAHGHLMWFEDEKYDLGEVSLELLKEVLRFHNTHVVAWSETERAYVVK